MTEDEKKGKKRSVEIHPMSRWRFGSG